MLLELDFLQFQPKLRLSKNGEATLVHDPIRRKPVALTPEELLRQLVLLFLLEEKKYPANRIRVEPGIYLNTLQKRCDIVVYDRAVQPWLLIECKSPKVPLTVRTFEQAARYNLTLQVPYLAITNGLATFCCALDYEQRGFTFLDNFPNL